MRSEAGVGLFGLTTDLDEMYCEMWLAWALDNLLALKGLCSSLLQPGPRLHNTD